MKFDVYVDSHGKLRVSLRQSDDGCMTGSSVSIAMHLGDASTLADQIKTAIAEFPALIETP